MSRLTREGELCRCTDKKRLSITLLIAFLSSIGLLAMLPVLQGLTANNFIYTPARR